MGIFEAGAVEGFIRCCSDGFSMGWHERNGGNLTYRMAGQQVEEVKPYFYETPGEWTKLGITAQNLAGEFFIATGSGKFMRNVALAPEENICIAEINEKGDSYRVVWGLKGGGVPTSEFPSHLLNHSVKKEITGGRHRVIYHAHTPNLIALTFILPLDAKEFSRVLWKSMTECPIVFPDGVGVVDWMVPGGSGIALATSERMKEFDAVVWAHHGIFCSGESFDLTFGLMHTIEKSAEIYMKILASGKEIRQTISDEELKTVSSVFGVKLRKEFLG